MTSLLCEGTIAIAFHVPVLCPQCHVSTRREPVILSEELLHQICTVQSNGLNTASLCSVHGAIELFLIHLVIQITVMASKVGELAISLNIRILITMYTHLIIPLKTRLVQITPMRKILTITLTDTTRIVYLQLMQTT